LNNNVKVIADISQKNKIKYFKKNFLFLNLKKKNLDKNLLFKKILQ
jgi:hypothetical protein